MWLVYPLTPTDIRHARRGLVLLLAASALWYITLLIGLAVWTDPILNKVRSKFVMMEFEPRRWDWFLFLLTGFVLAGGLRLLGYRYTRTVGAAVGAVDGMTLAQIGGLIWLGACLTVYFGFTGFLGMVTAFGSAFELKFLRFPTQLFGMVVSLRSLRWLNWYFYARSVWLGAVTLAGLILLIAHILMDLPRHEGGTWEQSITRVNNLLSTSFYVLAWAAIVTLPILTVGYWAILYRMYVVADRLLDPNGPVVAPEPPVKPGFDQLKHVLHNPP